MTNPKIPLKDSSEEVDPVCGMKIAPRNTELVSIHEGKSYWFCAEACRRAFEADPGKYLKYKKKGRIRRWLDRMAKSNQQAFGSSGPKCH